MGIPSPDVDTSAHYQNHISQEYVSKARSLLCRPGTHAEPMARERTNSSTCPQLRWSSGAYCAHHKPCSPASACKVQILVLEMQLLASKLQHWTQSTRPVLRPIAHEFSYAGTKSNLKHKKYTITTDSCLGSADMAGSVPRRASL